MEKKRVINRSGSSLEVFGDVGGGVMKRFALFPGNITDSVMDCIAVKAMEAGRIFESMGWWRLMRKETTAYRIERSGRTFIEDLSLHGIPYGPEPPNPPFSPGYEPLPDSAITAPLEEILDLQHDAPSPGPFDGEFDRDKEANADDLAGGIPMNRWFGRYVRTGQFISVRVNINAFPTIADNDLEVQMDEWKETIERTWNTNHQPNNGTEDPLRIEIDYSDESAHYSVFVPNKLVNTVTSFFGGRASMFYWPLDLDDDSNGNENVYKNSAHEFGHFLGLQDEYLWEGETPYLMHFVSQFPSQAGNKLRLSLAASLLSLSESNENRAMGRTLELSNPPSATLMEDSYFGAVDERLLDRVHDRHVQSLNFTHRHLEYALLFEYLAPDAPEGRMPRDIGPR